jgi:hypothetical protein
MNDYLNTVEADANVGDADALVTDIERLEIDAAPLRAVYGPGGTYDNERKALLCAIAVDIRDDYTGKTPPTKVTEAQLDQESHASEQYRARITQATDERTTLALLEAEIAAKTRRYELARARLYLTGRMAGLA